MFPVPKCLDGLSLRLLTSFFKGLKLHQVHEAHKFISIVNVFSNHLVQVLDDGKCYRKHPFLIVKSMVCCKCSQQPIQWSHLTHVFLLHREVSSLVWGRAMSTEVGLHRGYLGRCGGSLLRWFLNVVFQFWDWFGMIFRWFSDDFGCLSDKKRWFCDQTLWLYCFFCGDWETRWSCYFWHDGYFWWYRVMAIEWKKRQKNECGRCSEWTHMDLTGDMANGYGFNARLGSRHREWCHQSACLWEETGEAGPETHGGTKGRAFGLNGCKLADLFAIFFPLF